MSNSASSQPQQLFCSGQIVALDNTNSILYGEIIQTIPQRQMCWVRAIGISLKVRPCAIAKLPGSENKDDEGGGRGLKTELTNDDSHTLSNEAPFQGCWGTLCISNHRVESQTQIIDLHRNVDLLFPLDLFRVAFDTELIPLLSKMDLSHHSCLNDTQTSRQYLNQFLKEIWQINRSKFQV